MKGNDLSNAAVPRIVIVFENSIGTLPDSRRPEWRKLSRKGKWDAVAGLFDLDQMMLRKITDLARRYSVTVDVVTYCGPAEFADALARLFAVQHVPVSVVQASTPEIMARRTSYEHDIARVYDGNPEHAMVYGRKGEYLEDYRQLGG